MFARSWEDVDDYFECPFRSVLVIGEGAEKLKLEEKLKVHAARRGGRKHGNGGR